jgi:sugar-specific transcriptional regulator TrmB
MEQKTSSFDFLRRLGLSEREITIYRAGLKLGKARASSIAKEANVSRPLAYQALEELMQKGLTSKTGSSQGAQFTMESPENLITVIQKKEHDLHSLHEELPHAISELLSFTPSISKQSGVRFYEGREAFKKVTLEALETKEKIIRSLAPIGSILDSTDPLFIKQWTAERNKRKIRTKSIWSNIHTEPAYQSPYRELRLAPKGMEFTSTILIYDNTVMVMAPPPAVFTMVVESEHFASTMKAVFDQIWNISQTIK